MNTYPIFAALCAALGGALFAEWRQAPPEPAGGFLHLSPLLEDTAGKPITGREAWLRRRGEVRLCGLRPDVHPLELFAAVTLACHAPVSGSATSVSASDTLRDVYPL